MSSRKWYIVLNGVQVAGPFNTKESAAHIADVMGMNGHTIASANWLKRVTDASGKQRAQAEG